MLLAEDHDDEDVSDEGHQQDDRHDVAIDGNRNLCYLEQSLGRYFIQSR